jgi:hypothetical protein
MKGERKQERMMTQSTKCIVAGLLATVLGSMTTAHAVTSISWDERINLVSPTGNGHYPRLVKI